MKWCSRFTPGRNTVDGHTTSLLSCGAWAPAEVSIWEYLGGGHVVVFKVQYENEIIYVLRLSQLYNILLFFYYLLLVSTSIDHNKANIYKKK
jgi:hypothetical protein